MTELRPFRKVSVRTKGNWGTFAEHHGDDIALYVALLVAFAVWLAATYGEKALYSDNRAAAVVVNALVILLAGAQWKLMPHRWLSQRVRDGAKVKMSTVNIIMSNSVIMPGSIRDFKSKKLFLMPLLALVTHGPDLLSGTLTAPQLAGADRRLKSDVIALGPVGGGKSEGNGVYTYSTSGLAYFADDKPESEEKLFFKLRSGALFVPHAAQEFEDGKLTKVVADSWPGYLISESPDAVVSENPVTCSNSQQEGEPTLKMEGSADDACVVMGVTYDPGSSGKTPEFSDAYRVCAAKARVVMRKATGFYEVASVDNVILEPERNISNIPRVADGEHGMCAAFNNIVSFAVTRKVGSEQSLRMATAWLIRTATQTSATGFGQKVSDIQAGSIFSELRYKMPWWANWAVVGTAVVTLIVHFYFVFINPSILPRAFDSAAIHCGRVLSENTARCMTRDWKAERGDEDQSSDFHVLFGARANEERDGIELVKIARAEANLPDVKAAHLEWGLPDEVYATMKPTSFFSNDDEWRGVTLGAQREHTRIRASMEGSLDRDMAGRENLGLHDSGMYCRALDTDEMGRNDADVYVSKRDVELKKWAKEELFRLVGISDKKLERPRKMYKVEKKGGLSGGKLGSVIGRTVEARRKQKAMLVLQGQVGGRARLTSGHMGGKTEARAPRRKRTSSDEDDRSPSTRRREETSEARERAKSPLEHNARLAAGPRTSLKRVLSVVGKSQQKTTTSPEPSQTTEEPKPEPEKHPKTIEPAGGSSSTAVPTDDLLTASARIAVAASSLSQGDSREAAAILAELAIELEEIATKKD